MTWRKRQQSRTQVQVTIQELLDKGLPRVYTPEILSEKCSAVYTHVYESYYGAGQSIYEVAA